MNRLALLLLLCLTVGAIAGRPNLARADSVTVDGDVASPLQVTAESLSKLKQVKVAMHEHDGTASSYEGVEVADILKEAGVTAGEHPGKAVAIYVAAIASDGYEVVFGLGELTPAISGRTIILAYRMNGKPLGENVGPMRIVIQDDKVQARCIRMVTELKVVQLRK